MAKVKLDGWDALIKRVDLSRLPCRVDLVVRRSALRDGDERLRVVMHVADMFDGHASTVNHETDMPTFFSLHSESARLDFIRRQIQRAFAHEVEECMWVDGKQVYHPHEERRRVA